MMEPACGYAWLGRAATGAVLGCTRASPSAPAPVVTEEGIW